MRKALDDLKAQTAKVEELQKRLAVSELTAVAKKYEVLGKKAEELAPKLYEMQKSGAGNPGGSTVYADYVALLDEQVTLVEKGGMFAELGKNTQGSATAQAALGIAAAEIAKNATGGMSSPDAIIKAYESNPELAVKIENEYKGGKA